MSAPAIQQRCWNHETREAACRCPECGRSFCRECVTEHEARLLCATCLTRLAREKHAEGVAWRRFVPAGMALAGLALGWALFFATGEALISIAERAEQASWQSR